MTTTIIGYHDKCSDGFTAAWAARRGLLKSGGPDTTIDCVALTHSDDVEAKIADAIDAYADGVEPIDVVFVDFCPSPSVLNVIADYPDVRNVLVLDHHDTAERACKGATFRENVDVRFDMDRSGAGLAWAWFNFGEPAPEFLRYVEDRDLWRNSLPNIEEVVAILYNLPRTFEEWDQLELTGGVAHMVEPGSAVLRMKDQIVSELIANAPTCEIAGYRVPCVNCPVFRSEIGNALAKLEGVPFCVVWYQTEPGKFFCSLRSERTNPAAIHVGDVAARYGGGGHKHAAGFTLNAPPLVLA